MMRIGIDLDNTIIDYNQAFLAAAHGRGLVGSTFTGSKQHLRDYLRSMPDGETQWQKLQGIVYGKNIHTARLFPGVNDFIQTALDAGHELFIVSHKTLHGHFDESKTNLREAALDFLTAQKLAISPKHIYFETTRTDKVSKLASLEPNWFIDDLVEVFEEKHFPENCNTILFHTSLAPAPQGKWIACKNWDEIKRTITL